MLRGQDAARGEAINQTFGVTGATADQIGADIAARARGGRSAAKQAASALYEDPALQAATAAPIDGAKAIYDGAFTVGGKAVGGNADLKTIADLMDNTPNLSFPDLQKLYARVGAIGREAGVSGSGDVQRVAGLLRDKMDEAMAGNPLFTQAKGKYAATMQKYDKGWTRDIFRTGSDGMPRLSGAQIPAKAVSAGADALEKAQAFTRMMGNNDAGMAAIKDYAGQLVSAKGTGATAVDAAMRKYGTAIGEIAPEANPIAQEAARAAGVARLARAEGSDTVQNLMTLAGVDRGFASKLLDALPLRAGAAVASHGGSEVMRMMQGASRERVIAALDKAMADPKQAAKIADLYAESMRSVKRFTMRCSAFFGCFIGNPIISPLNGSMPRLLR